MYIFVILFLSKPRKCKGPIFQVSWVQVRNKYYNTKIHTFCDQLWFNCCPSLICSQIFIYPFSAHNLLLTLNCDCSKLIVLVEHCYISSVSHICRHILIVLVKHCYVSSVSHTLVHILIILVKHHTYILQSRYLLL